MGREDRAAQDNCSDWEFWWGHFFPFINLFKKMSFQFSSVSQLCPTLCDHMNRSTPGLPVHHQLPKFTQTHVHRVSDAIQPSHPLSSPSPPPFNLSQTSGSFPMSQIFASGGQSISQSEVWERLRAEGEGAAENVMVKQHH